jgi:hypothetical protein
MKGNGTAMTDPVLNEATQPAIEQLHHLLLRVDSRLPDELVATARAWLGEGLVLDVAEAVVFSCLSCDVPLAPADAELLGEILGDAGAETAAVVDLTRSEEDVVPAYRLAPVGPDVLGRHGSAVPHTMDLTGAGHVGPGGPDNIDRVAVAAAADQNGTHALWRSWRYPAPQDQWPQATRGYLVQMAPGSQQTGLATTAARVQAALVAAGETNPLVRVFTDDAALPAFHRMTLLFSALLWTAQTQPEIQVAPHRSTTVTGSDAPRLEEPERSRVLAYLAGGTPLRITAELTEDAVDPTSGAVVPTNLRTDGEWIWTDATRYYLDRYRLAPDDRLLTQIRRRGYRSAEVSRVALHRALAAVQPNATGGPGSAARGL